MEFTYKTKPDFNKDIKPHMKEKVNNNLTNTSKKVILEYLEDCEISLKKLENDGENIGHIFFQRINEFRRIVQEELEITDPIQYGRINAKLDLFSILKESGIKHKDYDSILQAFYFLRDELMELNIFNNLTENENEN